MRHLTLLIGAYMAFMSNNFAPLGLDTKLWIDFKQDHSKSYESEQVEELRRAIFAKNLQEIRKFNGDTHNEARQHFELDINHLADMSLMDMKQLNGFQLPRNQLGEVERDRLRNTPEAEQFIKSILEDNTAKVPDSMDWRTVPGRVSAVKNQGQCGSCWAFASTGTLEGQEAVRGVTDGNKSLVELSEQNLVDCVTKDYGCRGGIMSDAFDFIKTEGGIDSEQSYPYEASQRKCRYDKSKSVLSDAGFAVLPEGDEEKLKEVVAKFGPVAVAIDASSLWFQFYRRGVYVNKHCGKKEDQLDHAVLVVGYGTDPKKGDYWIVKNSWGPHWGDHGYIKMARNRKNMCGIATIATLPTF
uniref:Cathepsin L n=1 Tax=Aceria tosichella TaxID=561515 RepID=A0A6G1SHL2_9ACAR